ncbi:HNH endonuclease [Shewanella bicestrii]
MNKVKACGLMAISERLELYSLTKSKLPVKIDGTSSGYQCLCKITNRDHFTLYHSGTLDESNENGLEIAFSTKNIAESLKKPDLIINNWLERVSKALPTAKSKTSHQYSRVGINDIENINYIISQLDFLYGITELEHRTFSLRPNRPKQAKFRESLLKIHGETCMITGCNDIEVLEACHIVPESASSEYSINNGLLLRADLHKLFDEGLMSINPKSGEVVFSKKLNSKEYQEMAINKLRIRLPEKMENWPDISRISEHYNLYFS